MAKKKMKSKTINSKVKRADLPATQGGLKNLRTEFKSDMSVLRHDMNAGFKKVDARFNDMNSKLSSVNARFEDMDAQFSSVNARFEDMNSQFNAVNSKFDQLDARLEKMNARLEVMNTNNSRALTLIEQQYVQNSASYDAAELIKDQQVSLAERVDELEAFQQGIERKLKRN